MTILDALKKIDGILAENLRLRTQVAQQEAQIGELHARLAARPQR